MVVLEHQVQVVHQVVQVQVGLRELQVVMVRQVVVEQAEQVEHRVVQELVVHQEV
jgi:hypothetical protein